MAGKLLMKRFAIKDVSEVQIFQQYPLFTLSKVPTWLKEFDEDNDGRLSYKEFKLAILPQSIEKEENDENIVVD